MTNHDSFNVGANVLVIREGKLLLGLRKNVFSDGTWGLPGGHLENYESLAAAAHRELQEETGLRATRMVFANLVNDYQRENHYLQIAFVAEGVKGEPLLKEPNRCAKWEWFDIAQLPKNLCTAHERNIELFLQGGAQFSDG